MKAIKHIIASITLALAAATPALGANWLQVKSDLRIDLDSIKDIDGEWTGMRVEATLEDRSVILSYWVITTSDCARGHGDLLIYDTSFKRRGRMPWAAGGTSVASVMAENALCTFARATGKVQ